MKTEKIEIEKEKRVDSEKLVEEIKEVAPGIEAFFVGAHTETLIDEEGREAVVFNNPAVEVVGEVDLTVVEQVITLHEPEKTDEEKREENKFITRAELFEILADYVRSK